MNWLEEAIQQTKTPTSILRVSPRPELYRQLQLSAKGHVVFKVIYTSGGIAPAYVRVYVRCKERWSYRISSQEVWVAVQGYEVGAPREHSRDTRAALVRMYTELFEDRCEQTGIRCVNERRKEMKRWMESSKSTDSQ